jgi:Fic family protein
MRYGLKRLLDDEFPMSLRLIREIHEILLTQVRGGVSVLTPGEFRTQQNWIGGANLQTARFVPPPPHEMQASLDNLEKYLHADDECPVLVRCALIHYQFETIHPFNDGNGRLGRLLITFYLVWRGVLDEPMLYISAYLKTHQQEYYDRLQQVRTDGNFESWVKFFLEGVVTVSEQVVQTTKRIQALERRDTDRILAGNVGHAGVLLLRKLMEQPVMRVKDVEKAVGVSYSKANNLIAEMEGLGILKQITPGKRNRKFKYDEYVSILAEGTEPTHLTGTREQARSE